MVVIVKDFNADNTKEFFAKQYYNRSEVIKPNQVSAMLRSVINFCGCYDNTQQEIKELKEILHRPIQFALEHYSDYLSEKTKKRINFNKSLAKLEWLYFRDGQARTKLNFKYHGDIDRPKLDKNIRFDDIVELREWLIMSIDEIFVRVANKNKFSLDFNVDAFGAKIMQVEANNNE